MNKTLLAEIISFLFHPIVFALFVPFLIIYHQTANAYYSLEWMGVSAFFLIIACIVFFLTRRKEFFSDFDIAKKEKRFAFYSISCIICIVYFIMAVLYKGIFFSLTILSLGIVIGLIILEMVNFYLKVSLHETVVAAFAVTVGLLYGFGAFFLSLWLVVLVGWARFKLKKHTRQELFVGIIVGCLITLITYAIGKLFI